MKELKTIDYKLLFELMKDSHRSDRQIAKALEVSQPTVTRRRAMLEESYIDGYTVLPKFGQIGFEIAALTFMKNKPECKTGEEKEKTSQKMKAWFMKQPNVVLVQEGRGMGWDSICVSLHSSYSEYAEFARSLEAGLSDSLLDMQTFQIDLAPGVLIKPFNLKYLANLKDEHEKK
jgi:DNA-binding Lrp family transcriptional regulator